MKEMILNAIATDETYLKTEGDNELDKSFYEGRIEALKWVLKQLPEEG
jgi:hypothetical protein